MKQLLKKHYIHISAAILLIAACFGGWMTFFAVINLLYALYWAVKIVRNGVRNLSGCQKVINAILLTVGTAFLVPFMLIPSWLFSAVYTISHPAIGENVPEHNFFNVVLKDASFINSYNFRACEGVLSENDLKLLVINRGWKLENITKPETICDTAGNLIEQHRSEKYEPTPVTVKNGYSYSTYNGTDSGIMYTWCRDSSKFYFFSSSR